MKKLFFLLLTAALWSGCSDSEEQNEIGGGQTGGQTGSQTQQPVSPDEILSRRIASADVTLVGECTYTVLFGYDGQGRLVSLTEDNFRMDDGYTQTPWTQRFAYDGNTITATTDYGEEVYRLENGRVVSSRYEETPYYWEETSYGYDTDGYLVSMSARSESSEYATVVSYGENSISFDEQGSGWRMICTAEYDRTQLNDLNIDLYGWSGFIEDLTEFWNDARLLGIAGVRLRYLPAKVTTTCEEDGETNTTIANFSYKRDGEYLSEVEVVYDGDTCYRIVFHYE